MVSRLGTVGRTNCIPADVQILIDLMEKGHYEIGMNDRGITHTSDRKSRAHRSGIEVRQHRLNATIPLESLVIQVDTLWANEPHVGSDLRSELIEELSRLEQRVEVLRLRSEYGASVAAAEVRDCVQVLLWLRERWVGAAAA